jgi:hypothetical protein
MKRLHAIRLLAASALAAAATANSTATATPWCTADGFTVNALASPRADPSSQAQIAVTLVNHSRESCMLGGYPGVDLVGPDDPTFGATYHLPRGAGNPQTFTLVPIQTATSTLTYLPGPPNGWVPTTIVVTPPDSTTQLRTQWPDDGGSVLRQDAATHPGTFIGPLHTN